jgi:capsid protein
VIGSGLKLQAEPNRIILESEKIKLDKQAFNELTEARFSIFCDSKDADYSGMKNLHQISEDAFLNSKIGGDVLVILRYEGGRMTVQLVDGAHVVSPLGNYENYNEADINAFQGNIKRGVEVDEKGQHVAYWVQTDVLKIERIAARNSSGLVTAFLVYGMKYRLDNIRGIPLTSAVMQTISEMDRYKEATIGAAEESAKVVYTIEHQAFSDGSNPLVGELKRARGGSADDIPVDSAGNALADKVAATTHKQTYNMPNGASMKSFNSHKELYFKDFYTTHINLVCSTVGIPPNVAMSLYDGNYSSSRAAIKEWEHTINVNRKDFYYQFYSHVYAFWLDIEILKNKIQAPGYLIARIKGDTTILYAYRNARFVGASVPHIDPLKEVQAARLKLGATGADMPLSTLEQETEALNMGEADANMEQYAEELLESRRLGIRIEPVVVKNPTV